MALGMVLAGLEEISFGQRIFYWRTPEALAAISSQKELNLHNVATGLFNRGFALAAILGGFVLPVVSGLSSRLAHLFQRLRIRPPAGPGVLPFAFAAIFLTPSKFRVIAMDEQELMSLLTIAILLGLSGLCLVRPGLRRWRGPVVAVTIAVVAIKALLLTMDGRWTKGYRPEEVKELFIAFGLFWYAWTYLRVQLAPVATTVSALKIPSMHGS